MALSLSIIADWLVTRAFLKFALDQPARPRRRQRVNIPQEDADDVNWEGAPVSNVTNAIAESDNQTDGVKKVLNVICSVGKIIYKLKVGYMM